MAEVDIYSIYIEHPDDWRFLRPLVAHAPSNVMPALFCAYLASWRHGAMNEPARHKKENAGRRAANSRIRTDAKKMEQGDTATRRRYAELVEYGPKQLCTTCQHCSLLGECKKDLPMEGALCPDWKADFI